eukprot:3496559-Alexandrium_andersonii.AAC.1
MTRTKHSATLHLTRGPRSESEPVQGSSQSSAPPTVTTSSTTGVGKGAVAAAITSEQRFASATELKCPPVEKSERSQQQTRRQSAHPTHAASCLR